MGAATAATRRAHRGAASPTSVSKGPSTQEAALSCREEHAVLFSAEANPLPLLQAEQATCHQGNSPHCPHVQPGTACNRAQMQQQIFLPTDPSTVCTRLQSSGEFSHAHSLLRGSPGVRWLKSGTTSLPVALGVKPQRIVHEEAKGTA